MFTNSTEISRITHIEPPRRTVDAATIHMRDFAEGGIDFPDYIEARAIAHAADAGNDTCGFDGPPDSLLVFQRRDAAIKLIRKLSESFMGNHIKVADMTEANELWLDIQSLILATEMAKTAVTTPDV
ncbi:hypothetical protein [Komagataeibacter oboediens]|uniref:hypothetical protein n=1 Tax=Komagataeibacter oboediens TaxID=65958 RepID=UPI001905BE0D|nr:hypothetical protein [Komagataeibacter oboediens]GCE79377.1 hypothetical protein MSKU3_0852 [Komagataeibacter oboediens]